MNNQYVRFFSLLFVLFLIYQAPEEAAHAAQGFGAFALQLLEGIGLFLERLVAGGTGSGDNPVTPSGQFFPFQ